MRLTKQLALAATVAACRPTPTPQLGDTTRAAVRAAPPTQLARATQTGYDAPAELAIRDATPWDDAWRRLHPGDAPPAPAVDFGREMVVVVALGQRPTGGVDVAIDSAVVAPDDGATVHYTVREPGAGCMAAQVITTPATAARVARAAGTVTFRRQTVATPC